MRSEPLNQHHQHIPQLAHLMHQEWHAFAPWASIAAIEARLLHAASAAMLPYAFIALSAQNQVLGTASIKLRELAQYPEHQDKQHWLGEVFIHPQQRGQGVGSALIRACIAYARHLGLPALYLYTPDQQALYRRFGWVDLEQISVNGESVTLMRLDLKP